MARVKLFEHSAKNLVISNLGFKYEGVRIKKTADLPLLLKTLSPQTQYVLKVDEGVKGRFKKGLIAVGIKKQVLTNQIKKFFRRGYGNVLLEQFVPHSPLEEKYLSIHLTKDGLVAYASPRGGVDIEKEKTKVRHYLLNTRGIEAVAKILKLKNRHLKKLITIFKENHFTFLEINPLLIKNGQPVLLDLAVQVDNSGGYFVNNNSWKEDDIVREYSKTPEEKAVRELNEGSQASFSLSILNKNGGIFLLLSGGGASLVIADEIHNLGLINELVNYGEYSGNPSEEETYLYTKQILSLIIKSEAKNKVLIIGGGVANFTDVSITFRGIIRALEEKLPELKKHKLKIFVRRGGPGQTKGLEAMETFLKNNKIPGAVYGPILPLHKIVKIATKDLCSPSHT